MEPIEKVGAKDSDIELPKGRSVRQHLVRLGFTPIRPGYQRVAVWYETKRKIARVIKTNIATIYLRKA
jgi:hypothetical protein